MNNGLLLTPFLRVVANANKGSQRRVNKKLIQDVDVPKACGQILEPGAPLALRLQGNLLYGVSRVFSQQCGYILNDAEKVQSDMLLYYRSLQQSDVDLHAGKAR